MAGKLAQRRRKCLWSAGTPSPGGGTWTSSPAPLRAATKQGSCHLGPGHHREDWLRPRGRTQEHVGNQCGQAGRALRTATGRPPLEANLGLMAWEAVAAHKALTTLEAASAAEPQLGAGQTEGGLPGLWTRGPGRLCWTGWCSILPTVTQWDSLGSTLTPHLPAHCSTSWVSYGEVSHVQ